ncbi:hypothetical protein PV10_08501 [Exophiala mesophila]|uniref:Uncharacterized protein n=1 Tax=Exophiala mesophila TaxID=212818 RepID=A0A0D1ZPY9_EXOME|nr:uncharacterized protein PV10_08501 [Exophiala mesophila]KIV88868.1 hypothetical protein PV10_08501 [Exophiala mesophila]
MSGFIGHMTFGRVVKALDVVALNEADISFLGIVAQKFALFGNLSVTLALGSEWFERPDSTTHFPSGISLSYEIIGANP